jgi:hypothetical protein
VEDRAAPYVLSAGETGATTPSCPSRPSPPTPAACSACVSSPWRLGDGAGRLEAQLDDQRVQVAAGGFLWVPRGTAHTFANAGPDPVQVLALALPGGVEGLFAEQGAYLASVQGPPDPNVLDDIGLRHGAPTVGPPIRSENAPDNGQDST